MTFNRILYWAAVVMAATALGLLGGIGWFYARSHVDGARLLTKAEKMVHARRKPHGEAVVKISCDASIAGSLSGVLEIPAISLKAPVLEGTSDANLAVAVGHVSASVWPGQDGTSVLAAHDVTWFHGLGALRRGDLIEYQSGCHTTRYVVESKQVVHAGSAVSNVPGRLALVTCWPLDALWYTGTRLVVIADEVGTTRSSSSSASPATVASAVEPAIAPGIQSVASLAANPTPLGTLQISGSPVQAWKESPTPLQDAKAAQDLFFAGLRSAEDADQAWWEASGPGEPMPAALAGEHVVGFGQSLATTLKVEGTSLISANCTVQLVLAGPAGDANWSVNVQESVHAGKLYIANWSMSRY